MNKKGVLGSLFIGILFLIISGISFYYWWTTSEPAKCVSSPISEQFWHSSLFLFGVMFLILAITIIYSACRPVTGCWGEGITQSAEVTGTNQDIKISNVRGNIKAKNIRRKK